MKTHLKSNYIGKSSSRTYVGHASEIKAVLEMQKNSQESPGVFRSLQESSGVFKSLQESSEIFRNLQESSCTRKLRFEPHDPAPSSSSPPRRKLCTQAMDEGCRRKQDSNPGPDVKAFVHLN